MALFVVENTVFTVTWLRKPMYYGPLEGSRISKITSMGREGADIKQNVT